MPKRRKKWRLPFGTVVFGLIGAVAATLLASPHLKMQFGRRYLAVDMQQEFHKHGLQYAVATSGVTDSILRIKASSMTRPFAEYLVRDAAKAKELAQLGFTAVVFANDNGDSWTYDVAQRRLR